MFKGIDFEKYSMKLEQNINLVPPFQNILKHDFHLKTLSFMSRDVDDKTSCQHLQILFSFSIPNPESVNKIKSLEKPIISAGAVSFQFYNVYIYNV